MVVLKRVFVWEVGFKCFSLSVFPAPCHNASSEKQKPLVVIGGRMNIKKENQKKTNQDEASRGGLLSIFVHYSCFKYQTLIIRN